MLRVMTLLVLGAALCLVVLLLRAAARRSAEKAGQVPPRTARQRLGTAKLLLAALLVWLVISFNLRHSLLQIDGADQPPSQWERLVRFLTDLF